MNQDEKYMKEAIRQAKKAYALKEVPAGEEGICAERSAYWLCDRISG